MRGAPPAYPGQRIGLFGGSFDPAHEGHAHVADTARKRLGLDRVWWLVTPQNPLKPESAPVKERIASARTRASRKDAVTAFEAAHGFRYTYQTIRALKRWYPGVHFVLIVGGDSLQSFRHWRRWQDVMRAVPIAIVARPGSGARSRLAKPAQTFAAARRQAHEATALKTAPAFVYLNAREHPQSSTAIRKARHA